MDTNIRKRTAIGLLFALIVTGGCTPPKFSERLWRKQVESAHRHQLYESHQKEGIFFNPWINKEVRLGWVLKWRLTPAQTYTEEEEKFLPTVRHDAERQLLKNRSHDFILWIGHGSYLIKTGSHIWLLDPMFSQRALLPARKTPPALTAEVINRLFPRVNVIISHNHYDHLDEDSIRQLSENYIFYVPLGIGKEIAAWNPNAKTIEILSSIAFPLNTGPTEPSRRKTVPYGRAT